VVGTVAVGTVAVGTVVVGTVVVGTVVLCWFTLFIYKFFVYCKLVFLLDITFQNDYSFTLLLQIICHLELFICLEVKRCAVWTSLTCTGELPWDFCPRG